MLILLGCTKNTLQNSKSLKNDTILLEKYESWGPCPNESFKCYLSTKLYYSGKLVLDGDNTTQKQLDKNSVDKIIAQIKQSQIMDKDCSASIVLDYGATYRLNINGHKKSINFPGCENDLSKIDDLIKTS